MTRESWASMSNEMLNHVVSKNCSTLERTDLVDIIKALLERNRVLEESLSKF